MARSFEELDYCQTALGELSLRRRCVRSLGDRDVYEVRLGGAFLMSSLTCEAERELATAALARLQGRPADVLIGGLGLGHTAQAALQQPGTVTVTVLELLDPVLRWFREGVVPLGSELTADPRCHLQQGDFFAHVQAAAQTPAYDAILLDVDHTPDNLLCPDHAPFYTVDGLRALRAHLRPGGVFGLWSAGPADARVTERLDTALAVAEAREFPFYNPLLDSEDINTVYLASGPADPD